MMASIKVKGILFGFLILVKVKKKKPSVKIVVLANSHSIRTRVLDYGADEFTLKPMNSEMLATRVLSLLSID